MKGKEELLEVYKDYEISFVSMMLADVYSFAPKNWWDPVGVIRVKRNGETIFMLGQRWLEKKDYAKSSIYHRIIQLIDDEGGNDGK